MSYLIANTWISYDTEVPDYNTISNVGFERIYQRINSINSDEVILQTDLFFEKSFWKITNSKIVFGSCPKTIVDCKSENIIWEDQVSYNGKWTLFCPSFEIKSAPLTSNSTTKSTTRTTTTTTSRRTTTTTTSRRTTTTRNSG